MFLGDVVRKEVGRLCACLDRIAERMYDLNVSINELSSKLDEASSGGVEVPKYDPSGAWTSTVLVKESDDDREDS